MRDGRDEGGERGEGREKEKGGQEGVCMCVKRAGVGDDGDRGDKGDG